MMIKSVMAAAAMVAASLAIPSAATATTNPCLHYVSVEQFVKVDAGDTKLHVQRDILWSCGTLVWRQEAHDGYPARMQKSYIALYADDHIDGRVNYVQGNDGRWRVSNRFWYQPSGRDNVR